MQTSGFIVGQIDLIIVGVYFAIMIGLGLWLSRGSESSQDYFLAGRTMTWPIVGLSLFASQISSTSLVGLAGAAYATGISTYNYEWMSAAILVFFCLFILPFIVRSQVYTMPEFLARRYDDRARTYFSIVTLVLNIVVDTAGSLFAGALIVKLIFPTIPIWQTISLLAFAAGLYTIMGGLKAVMVTDVVQAVILILGSILIAYFAIDAVGGLAAIEAQVSAEKMSLFRPIDDPATPWLGVLIGIPILGFYFWCTNQFIVQRVLSAKNLNHARWGSLFGGLLKIPVLFTMVIPGSAAILLYPDLSQPDLVYPTLMFELLPTGILGLVLAGFVAALMSQIDSTLNSASTLVTMDFIRRYRPQMSDLALMKAGRFVTFGFMLIAVLWAPQIENFGSLFQYLQNVLAYAVPPVVVLFLFGIFWKKANAAGAMATIVAGVVGAAVLFFMAEFPGNLLDLHFLYAAPILFVISSAAMLIGSRFGEPTDPAIVEHLSWTPDFFREETEALKTQHWATNYRLHSAIILILCVVVIARYW